MSAPSGVPVQHSSEQKSWCIGSYRKWLQLGAGLPGTLWTVYAVIAAAFFVARIHYTFPEGLAKNIERGEYYHFRIPLNKLFLWLHLVSVLPAALLAVLQFIPRIRTRAISLHRTVGKAVNALTFVSTVSAWGIAHVSFGGDLTTRAGVYVFGGMVLWATVASWRAIRQLRIDEHRAWLIRAWGYQMSNATMRLVMVAAMIAMSVKGGFYQSISCQEVEYILDDAALYAHNYPQCQAEWMGHNTTHVTIEANLENELGIASGTRQTFGMSLWVGLWIHAIIVEYYLHRTKEESARLREVSTRRQNAYRALKEQHSKVE